MYMMYYLDDNGKRVYTLAKVDPKGRPTFSAHPGKFFHLFFQISFSYSSFTFLFTARFSPEDRYAAQRIMIKKRFDLLITSKLVQTSAN